MVKERQEFFFSADASKASCKLGLELRIIDPPDDPSGKTHFIKMDLSAIETSINEVDILVHFVRTLPKKANGHNDTG